MRINNWFSIGCLSVAITSLGGLSASADLVLNAGFENGTGTDADDWGEISDPNGTVIRSGDMPNSGSFAALMSFDNTGNPAPGAYFIQQTSAANAIDGTQDLNLSFHAKSQSADFTGVNMFFQVQWLDLDGSDGGGFQGQFDSSLIGLGLNTSYQEFSFTGIDVPDTADGFLIRFQIAAGAVADISNGLYVDDVVLTTAIPEPCTLSVFGIGAIGLLARRRNR